MCRLDSRLRCKIGRAVQLGVRQRGTRGGQISPGRLEVFCRGRLLCGQAGDRAGHRVTLRVQAGHQALGRGQDGLRAGCSDVRRCIRGGGQCQRRIRCIQLGTSGSIQGRRRAHLCEVGGRVRHIQSKSRHEGRLRRRLFDHFGFIGRLCCLQRRLRIVGSLTCGRQRRLCGDNRGFGRLQLRVQIGQLGLRCRKTRCNIIDSSLCRGHKCLGSGDGGPCILETRRSGHAGQGSLRVAQGRLCAAQRIRSGHAFAFQAGHFRLRRVTRRQCRFGDTFRGSQVCLRRRQPFPCRHKRCLRQLEGSLGHAKVTCVLQRQKRGAGVCKSRLRVDHGLIGRRTDRGQRSDIGNRRVMGLLGRSHSRFKRRALQRNGGVNVGGCGLRVTQGAVGGGDLVRDAQHRLTGHAVVRQHRGDGGRVRKCLVGNQVRDDPRVGVIDRAAGLQIGGLPRLRRARVGIRQMRLGRLGQEGRVQQARHDLIGRAPGLTAFRQVVQGPVHKTQAQRQRRIRDQIGKGSASCMLFGDQNLVKNVLEVIGVDENHCRSPG